MTVVVLFSVISFLLTIGAYFTNLVWLFAHFTTTVLTLEGIVGLVGVLAVPLGVLHGIYLWF